MQMIILMPKLLGMVAKCILWKVLKVMKCVLLFCRSRDADKVDKMFGNSRFSSSEAINSA